METKLERLINSLNYMYKQLIKQNMQHDVYASALESMNHIIQTSGITFVDCNNIIVPTGKVRVELTSTDYYFVYKYNKVTPLLDKHAIPKIVNILDKFGYIVSNIILESVLHEVNTIRCRYRSIYPSDMHIEVMFHEDTEPHHVQQHINSVINSLWTKDT